MSRQNHDLSNQNHATDSRRRSTRVARNRRYLSARCTRCCLRPLAGHRAAILLSSTVQAFAYLVRKAHSIVLQFDRLDGVRIARCDSCSRRIRCRSASFFSSRHLQRCYSLQGLDRALGTVFRKVYKASKEQDILVMQGRRVCKSGV